MYFLEAIVRPPFPLKQGWHVATFCPVSVTFMVEKSHDLIASESKGDRIQQPENREPMRTTGSSSQPCSLSKLGWNQQPQMESPG